MKKLTLLLGLLIGLGANAQTTTHMTIQGRFYDVNKPIVNPQLSFDIEVWEWDTVLRTSTLLQPSWYTVNYNSNAYQLVLSPMYLQTKPLMLRAKPKPGTPYEKYAATWSPRSTNQVNANKAWFSIQNPTTVMDFFMIPSYGQLVIFRHTF